MIDRRLQLLAVRAAADPRDKKLVSAVDERCEVLNAEAAGITLARYREIREEESDEHLDA